MLRNLPLMVLLPVVAVLSGCPVFQSQDTPVSAVRRTNPQSHRGYWLYVPSTYTAERSWPLVITLHGTYAFDGSGRQINEWKALAEQKGFIVTAPDLDSVQGILPTVRALFLHDLQQDEQAVLAIADELCEKYRIASVGEGHSPGGGSSSSPAAQGERKCILLTGFSGGGYPMYYIGLRNPLRFNMLVARSCNSDIKVFENLHLTDEARKLPIVVLWGKDDIAVDKYSWQAVQWLKNHDFVKVHHRRFKGGHLRRPERTYAYWEPSLPEVPQEK